MVWGVPWSYCWIAFNSMGPNLGSCLLTGMLNIKSNKLNWYINKKNLGMKLSINFQPIIITFPLWLLSADFFKNKLFKTIFPGHYQMSNGLEPDQDQPPVHRNWS